MDKARSRGERAGRRADTRSSPGKIAAATIPSEKTLLYLAIAIRAVLIMFGRWQDSNLDVSYTDVDYMVYSDAAQFICQGDSPYNRSTYRYTPLLAWLLVPNCVLPEYGKILFSAYDIMAAMIMLLVLSAKGVNQSSEKGRVLRALCIAVWLFNPFTATISTRGNGEAIVVCLLLGLLYMLESGQILLSAVLYGVVVHWRIFPIVYAPSILLHIAKQDTQDTAELKQPRNVLGKYISLKGIIFGVVSGFVFFVLGGIMHALYGVEFLEETYLYHFSRVDPRHNFSPYFYPAYLNAGSVKHDERTFVGFLGDTGSVFGIVGLLMQAFIAHQTAPNDISMAFMIQSFAFVAFNKVSTAQYFVWYLCWLPITLPTLLSTSEGVRTLIQGSIIWPICLGHWLLWAYLLEFKGQPVHLYVWVAGIMFFFANIWCIVQLLCLQQKVSRKCLQ